MNKLADISQFESLSNDNLDNLFQDMNLEADGKPFHPTEEPSHMLDEAVNRYWESSYDYNALGRMFDKLHPLSFTGYNASIPIAESIYECLDRLEGDVKFMKDKVKDLLKKKPIWSHSFPSVDEMEGQANG